MGIKNAPFLSVAFIFFKTKNVKQQGEGYLIPKSLLVALKTLLAAVDCRVEATANASSDYHSIKVHTLEVQNYHSLKSYKLRHIMVLS